MSRRGPIHTVFVGNLAYEVTEEQLHEAFQRVGPVLAVRCAIPPPTERHTPSIRCGFHAHCTSRTEPHRARRAARGVGWVRARARWSCEGRRVYGAGR